MTSKSVKLATACMLMGSILGWHGPAIAASDNSSDTYAGDYQGGGSLPAGTFLFLQYAGWNHSNQFIDTAGVKSPNSHLTTWEEFSRFTYVSQFGGHNVIWEAELPFASLSNASLPGTINLPNTNPNLSATQSGFVDPVVHVTYYFIQDPKVQRWLGFTNYVYLPLGNYDNTKGINVGQPRQTTDVPQIGYTEGLGKFSPALNGLFFDFIGNASIHSHGTTPISYTNSVIVGAPNTLVFTDLQQRASYDVKGFLRYEPRPSTFFAVGIEKSWGGEMFAKNGTLTIPALSATIPLFAQSLTKDDYLRGHIQASYPLGQTWSIAADLFHDFDRVGGFREDTGLEFRVTKIFLPTPGAAPSYPTK